MDERDADESSLASLTIDVPDPASIADRSWADGDDASFAALCAATTARIGVGRAGPRPRTATLLRFQGDHAVTRDALSRDVDHELVEDLGLFVVQTRVTGGRGQYLLRPDLGRSLSDHGRRLLAERCAAGRNLQIALGDGLSVVALEANARILLPSLLDGARDAGLSVGTPFLIKQARVGVINEIGSLLHPEVVVLLIGERPGLGRADSLSAYLAYQPKAGDTDADRDVISNIYAGGGLDPAAAATAILRLVAAMREHRCSGVRLKTAIADAAHQDDVPDEAAPLL